MVNCVYYTQTHTHTNLPNYLHMHMCRKYHMHVHNYLYIFFRYHLNPFLHNYRNYKLPVFCVVVAVVVF